MGIEKFLPTEDGLCKLSNTAKNLILISGRSLKLTTNKMQKENPETIERLVSKKC